MGNFKMYQILVQATLVQPQVKQPHPLFFVTFHRMLCVNLSSLDAT